MAANGVKDQVKHSPLQWLLGAPGAGAAPSLAAPLTALFNPEGENTLKFHVKYAAGAAGNLIFTILGEDLVTPGTFTSQVTLVTAATGAITNSPFTRAVAGATDDFEFAIPFSGKRKYQITVSHSGATGTIRLGLEQMVTS